MRILDLSARASSICVAVLLIACDGGHIPLGAPEAPQNYVWQSASHASTSTEALVYAFNDKCCSLRAAVFDYPSGHSVSFSAPGLPYGACSDDRGDVFLIGHYSGADRFYQYTYGSTTPSESIPISGEAVGCTVDNGSGNVATVTYEGGAHPYDVAVFRRFKSPARLYSYSGMVKLLSVGYDGRGDLFLLGVPNNGAGYALAELRNRAHSFEPISLGLGSDVAQASTVQWDGRYVTIEAIDKTQAKPKDWPHVLYRLTVTGKTSKVVGMITLRGLRGTQVHGTSWIQPNRDIVIYARGWVAVWKYPKGGREIKTMSSGFPVQIATVAVSASQLPDSRH